MQPKSSLVAFSFVLLIQAKKYFNFLSYLTFPQPNCSKKPQAISTVGFLHQSRGEEVRLRRGVFALLLQGVLR